MLEDFHEHYLELTNNEHETRAWEIVLLYSKR